LGHYLPRLGIERPGDFQAVEPLIRGQRSASWFVKVTEFVGVIIEIPEVTEEELHALEVLRRVSHLGDGRFEDALIWSNRHDCSLWQKSG
jgi:hypothetical protein